MAVKQTNLFQKIKIPQLTQDEKAYRWLCKHHFAGYNGKYNLYCKNQLYKLLKWDILYGNHSAETKSKLIMLTNKIKKSSYSYFHIKALTNILSYPKWILIQIYHTEIHK